MTLEEEVARKANTELTLEEEVALTANMELTREKEVALYGEHGTDARRRSGAHGEHGTDARRRSSAYGEHIRLKAFYQTAVERLYFNVVCAYQAWSACSSFSFSTSASDKFVSSAISSRE